MATTLQSATQTLTSRNPADNSVIAELPITTDAELHDIVLRAKSAQKDWQAEGIHKRLKILKRFQQLLLAQKEEIAQLISREAGKPIAEALTTEVLVVLDVTRFLLKHAFRALRSERVPHGNLIMMAKRGHIHREPYGVIGIIAPWNYPLSTPASESLAALAAGNAVIVKPSEFTPMIALKLERLLHDAGVPRDVFRAVIGEGPTGAVLIDSPIDKLIFTGSVATGIRVGEAAARRLLPVVLELGGKDPMLVFDDVNLDVASSAAVWGAFMNAGQTCLSVERCYVQRGIYDRFVQMCVEKTNRLKVGRGDDPSTEVGPMIHEKQLRIVESQVEDARQKGATILTGGRRLTHLGPNFYAPTIITTVNNYVGQQWGHAEAERSGAEAPVHSAETRKMSVLCDETFGPVLPIIPFDTEDEAIALANNSEFGLAASVWTNDRARADRVAAKLQAGTVLINDVIVGFGISEAPHGGIKSSGIGRTHGLIGLEELVRYKYVDRDLLPFMKKVWWYGYGATFRSQMAAFSDMLFSTNPLKRLTGALKSTGALFRKQP